MVELQTFCHEILGRVLRDGRIDSPGDRTYCIAAKYDGIKNAGSEDLCATQQNASLRAKAICTIVINQLLTAHKLDSRDGGMSWLGDLDACRAWIAVVPAA
jgi:hypothetical protein